MLLMKESVLNLTEKNTIHWFSYFQIDCKYLKSFKTHPLNNILTISVNDYKAIGSSSVIPQGH